MAHRRLWIALVATLVLGASLTVTSVRADDERDSWVAVLAGSSEVPAVDTRARGQAFFQLSDDGLSIRYRVIVANVRDVTMSHIHFAPGTPTGGIVVWLYPASPPPVLIPGRSDGVLMEGSFTAANLVGALAGSTLAVLIDHINMGHTYVNVHTSANPGGEIRGTINPAE